jgi:hypothetical protein
MLNAKRICNPQDALALLNCRRLPARLNTSEVAVLLGFQEHDIAPLIAARLMAPLGKPAPNAPKYFATVEIAACPGRRLALTGDACAGEALARQEQSEGGFL